MWKEVSYVCPEAMRPRTPNQVAYVKHTAQEPYLHHNQQDRILWLIPKFCGHQTWLHYMWPWSNERGFAERNSRRDSKGRYHRTWLVSAQNSYFKIWRCHMSCYWLEHGKSWHGMKSNPNSVGNLEEDYSPRPIFILVTFNPFPSSENGICYLLGPMIGILLLESR